MSVDIKLVWGVISTKIGTHIIQAITIGHTMVYMAKVCRTVPQRVIFIQKVVRRDHSL